MPVFMDAAAARHFSKKFDNVRESTVKSIKTVYLQVIKWKRTNGYFEDIRLLPTKKWGHGVLLGEVLDKKLQMYLKEVINNGGLLTAAVAIDTARGLLLAENQNKLAEFGGHIDLNRHWAYSQYKRMGFVQKINNCLRKVFS